MSESYRTPKLTLVGTGPGHPDLLSIRAAQTIAAADVLLYDDSVDTRVLVYARKDAVLIHTGNPSFWRELKADDINVLIARYALTHGHVVRLRGGDLPERSDFQTTLEYANSLEIETAWVPGIRAGNLPA